MPFVNVICTNCGGEIQLDNQKESGFCLYCGSKVIFKEAVRKTKYEYCEIVYAGKQSIWIGSWNITFWAKAVGEKGSYNAGESEKFFLVGARGGNPPTGVLEKDKKNRQLPIHI